MNRYHVCHCNDNINVYVLHKYLSVPTLVCPRAILIDYRNQRVHPLQVTLEIFGTEIKYYLCQKDGVDFVFVSHPSYQRLGIYGDAFGPFKDNQVARLHSLSFKSYLLVTKVPASSFERTDLSVLLSRQIISRSTRMYNRRGAYRALKLVYMYPASIETQEAHGFFPEYSCRIRNWKVWPWNVKELGGIDQWNTDQIISSQNLPWVRLQDNGYWLGHHCSSLCQILNFNVLHILTMETLFLVSPMRVERLDMS